MKARDLMVPAKERLAPGDGFQEFLDNIQAARTASPAYSVRTLPVLDSEGRLVGVLSMFDILRAVHPEYLFIADLHSFTWDGMLESLARKAAGKKVSDLMTRPVVTVHEDHPLMECVDQMIRNRISTVFIVDDQGRLQGALHEEDILFAMAEALRGGTHT